MNKTLDFSIEVAADTSCLSDVREQVADVVKQTSFDGRQQALLVLAIDEAVSNLMQEKQINGHQGSLLISLTANETCLKVIVADSTVDYIEDDQSATEFSRVISNGRDCKLGIFLMRLIMDEVSYSYKRGFQNQLIMLKFLNI